MSIFLTLYCFSELFREARQTKEDIHSRGFYKKYLKSDIWEVRRRLALEHYGKKCAKCGAGKQLEVHHKTYKRKFCERLEDLIVLCSRCHKEEHMKPNEQLDWIDEDNRSHKDDDKLDWLREHEMWSSYDTGIS